MVCIRCKMAVRDQLTQLGFHCITVELGEAEIAENITDEQHDLIQVALLKVGLELMDNKKSIADPKDKKCNYRTGPLFRRAVTGKVLRISKPETELRLYLPRQYLFRSTGHHHREVHHLP